MARGASGRIVVEVDPQLKREIYAALARRGMTLKDWLVTEAQTLITTGRQMPLFVVDEGQTTYDRSETGSSEGET